MRRSGFTLLEILVVVTIMAIIAALALPKLSTAVQKSNVRSARVELGTWFAKARAVAVQRGCVDTLRIHPYYGNVLLWACKVTGTGRDTIGKPDQIESRLSVDITTDTYYYVFDPRGILIGGSGGTITITSSDHSATDSVVVNAVGKVTH